MMMIKTCFGDLFGEDSAFGLTALDRDELQEKLVNDAFLPKRSWWMRL